MSLVTIVFLWKLNRLTTGGFYLHQNLLQWRCFIKIWWHKMRRLLEKVEGDMKEELTGKWKEYQLPAANCMQSTDCLRQCTSKILILLNCSLRPKLLVQIECYKVDLVYVISIWLLEALYVFFHRRSWVKFILLRKSFSWDNIF